MELMELRPRQGAVLTYCLYPSLKNLSLLLLEFSVTISWTEIVLFRFPAFSCCIAKIFATTRDEADVSGGGCGWAVLIKQQRLALNLSGSGGSYEKRIV